MRVRFMSGSCFVQRDPEDVAYANTQYGERRFLLALLGRISSHHMPIDAPTGFICRKATELEQQTIDADFGLFRERDRPGRIWAIYYETSRGDTAAGTFTSNGKVRLAVARIPRRRRCRKR